MRATWSVPGSLLVIQLASAAGAAAATLTYPGCGALLRFCTQAAAPGDVVEIATDQPIDEDIALFQSLTLRSAAGFHATFAPGRYINVLHLDAGPGVYVVQGLTILDGTISVLQESGGTMSATIAGNSVQTTAPPSFCAAIYLNVDTAAPVGDVQWTVADNHIQSPCTYGVSAIAQDLENAVITITGNDIASSGSLGAGISVITNTNHVVTAQAARNRVSPGGNTAGIVIGLNNAGSISIVDNLVSGQRGQGGEGAAIEGLSGLGPGYATAQVVNNTVAYNDSGIVVRAHGGVVANNLVAYSTAIGISITGASNDHNLDFANGGADYTPGPGTVTADPRFLGATDLHLQATSPAIDAGNDLDLPPGTVVDLDGNPRISGAAVDIGAYEFSTATVALVPTLGGTSLAVLGAALAAAALLRLRARRGLASDPRRR